MTWPEWVTTVSAAAVGASALIASGSYLARTIGSLMESRRQSRRVWPIRSVSRSYLGPGGQHVAAGAYRCLRDLHELDVTYETATAKCSACGRRYTVMFGPG
jgi:hypothetical protein